MTQKIEIETHSGEKKVESLEGTERERWEKLTESEKSKELYRSLRNAGIATVYDEQAAIGKRYRRQDEIGTPWCLTVDNDTMADDTVTLRDRDTLEQVRMPVKEVVDEIARRLRG